MAAKLCRDTLDWVKAEYKALNYPVGELHQNHQLCPGGEDRRKRLYTTLVEDGSKILCHCFNCGASGVVFLKAFRSTLFEVMNEVASGKPESPNAKAWATWLHAQTQYKETDPLYLSDAAYRLNEWPYSGFKEQSALLKWQAMNYYGMRKHVGGFIMTPRGEHGFDFRTIGAKNMWRVTHPDHAQDSKLLVYNTNNSDIAVIVEDPISAMKVDICGYAGVALCGSSLSNEDAFKLSMRFKYFVVWLDNDSPEIIANSKIARARLLLYTNNVGLNFVDSDPKKYDCHAITHEIKACVDNMG
jgi:hypothetical protein